MGEVKSEDMDDEMMDDVHCVRDLLDRLKDEKEKELLSAETSSSSEQEKDAKQPDFIAELQKKQTSVMMNLKPVHRTTAQDSPNNMDTSSQRDKSEQNNTEEPSNVEGSPKRKQDQFLAEIQERAEVISKSARKAPESIVTSIGTTNALEEDPETEEFLKIIRTASAAESKLQAQQGTSGTARRRKSTSDIDFSVVVSNCSMLNVEPQKSKIPLGRQGSLNGRRKPTASVRRRSLRQGVGNEWADAAPDKISEGEESMDEGEGVKSLPLQGNFVIKDLPQWSDSEGPKPRTKPKHRVKSKTVSGIALPGLADELNRKRMVAVPTSLDLKRPQESAAEIVRAAAEGKRSLPVKEEKLDKEPEKPSWLAEAEARRKLHEKRRQVRTKVAKDVDDGATKLESGILPSTSKPERVMTKSDDDIEETKSHNVFFRLLSKTEPTGSKIEDGAVWSKPRNGFLRPVPKSEQSTNEENDTGTTVQSVFLRPVLRSTPITNKSKADNRTTKFPMVFLRPVTRTDPVTNGHEQSPGRRNSVQGKPISTASVSTSTDRIPTSRRRSSEFTSPISPTVKPVTLSGDEIIEGKDCKSHSAEEVSSLETSQCHMVRPVRAVSSEKLNSLRQETSKPEISTSQSSRLTATRVTVSSNYVTTPPKIAPKTRPKSTMRSKTVTVTATEVPHVSTTRRTSAEMIHAKAERSPARPSSAVMTGSQVTTSSDVRTLWRGSEYRPTYTGEVLPQWKVDLMEKKRNAIRTPDSSQPSYTLSAAVVPQWKKDLADKRRQRADSGIVQTSNKENQPKTSPEIPQWKREFSERRKRRENSAVRQQPDGLDWSADASEWKQRLSTSRRIQTNVIPKSETDASPDPVPSFMKEFEKKKKRLPRGGHTSYV